VAIPHEKRGEIKHVVGEGVAKTKTGAFLSLSELFYCHCDSFKRRTKQSRRIRSEHGTTTESFQRKD